MPIYSWRCRQCYRTEEIEKPIEERYEAPKVETRCTDESFAHNWTRYFPSPPAKGYGAAWGKRKGES